MEHPGLVTYGIGACFSRKGGVDRHAARLGERDQWFGNLVTMARHPLRGDYIHNAFDEITYAKGEAVLEMVEAWLGEDVFRRGVQAYLERHAWGNAAVSDFLTALSSAAGRDVAAVLGSFLDQTGAPVLSAEVHCDGPTRLALTQRPYRALGSTIAPRTWQVPVCVKAAGLESGPTCSLLTQAAAEVKLEGAACPDWAYANAGATGYYRTLVSAEQARRALGSGALTEAERVALAGDLDALVSSGDLPAGDALGLLPVLAQDAERQVVRSGVGLAQGLEPVVATADVPRYEALVRSVFGPRARQMGLAARPGETEDVRLLRPSLIGAVGGLGADPEVRREVLALAWRWLDDPTAIDPDMVETVLAVGGAAADASLVERLRADVVRAGDREQRQRLLGALGSVRDPALARQALALTLEERLDARESIWILFRLAGHRETRREAVDFLKSHYDALVGRLPKGTFSPAAYLPWVAAGLCDADTRQEMEAYFGPRAATIEGAPRVLQQALESVEQCLARKRAQQPSVAAYLQAQPGAPIGGH